MPLSGSDFLQMGQGDISKSDSSYKVAGNHSFPNLSPEPMVAVETVLFVIERTSALEGILDADIGLQIWGGIVVDPYGYGAGKDGSCGHTGVGFPPLSAVVHCIYV